MSRIAENIITAIKRTKKETLTQTEIFELVLSITKHEEAKLVECGSIKLNRSQMTVSINDRKTKLPKLEFELLSYLIKNEGNIVPREILMRDVWGGDVCVATRTIDVCVCKLRIIIGKEKIETIKKVGYKFVDVK